MSVKTWKTKEDAIAGIQVGDAHVTMAVSDGKKIAGIHADESGLYLRGKISILTQPQHIRVGGFWVQNSAWRQMFPSSIAFPNPALVMKPGMQGITGMISDIQFMMGFLL